MISACRYVMVSAEITALFIPVLSSIHEDTLTLLLSYIKQPSQPISCLVTTGYTLVAPRHAHKVSALLSGAVIVVDMLVEQCFCILSVHVACGRSIVGGLAITLI